MSIFLTSISDLQSAYLLLPVDPPALSSTLHPLSALPSVYPTTITTSTGSVNPSYNTPASNVPSPPNSISPPAGSVDPLSDTPTSIPTSTVPSTSNPTVESPAASNKRKNARSHDKRAKIRRIRKEEKAGPSSNTYANVLSHGTAIEVEADATHFSAAKGAVIIWTRFPLRLNFYLPINTPIVAGTSTIRAAMPYLLRSVSGFLLVCLIQGLRLLF